MTPDMALSADGTSLAAVIGPSESNKLYVYQLPKGKPHVWSWSACRNCSGGDGTASGPSWAADGRTVAFLFFFSPVPGIGVRLLDTHAAGTGLLTDSKLAVPVADDSSPVWQQVIITPDGRTVFAVLENEPLGQRYNQQLVRFSVATGQRAAVLNQPPIGNHFEHIQWTSPTGNTLLISAAQHGGGAGVLKGGRYTPIPWSSKIFAAAW
jgi:WD40 repeat protein